MPRRWIFALRYFFSYRTELIWGLVALGAGNLLLVAAPLAVMKAVAVIEGDATAALPINYGAVAAWAALSFVLTLAAGVAAFHKRNLLMRVSRRAETDLRRDLFRHVQRLPRPFFDRVRTGDLMSRATSDVEAVRMAVGPGGMYLADALSRSAAALVAMLLISPALTLYALVPLAGIAAGLFVLAPRLHRTSRLVQDQQAGISARAQESFAGARVVKTFATEDREAEDMERLGREYLASNLRLARLRGVTDGYLTLMIALGLGLILYEGGTLYGRGRIDIGGILAFQAYQGMLLWPMMAFGWVLSLLQRGAASLDRLQEVFRVAREAGSDGGAPRLRGEIEFRDLSFSYGGKRVLHGVSLEIRAGQTVGITGPTGSGKSTLVSLLPRLYDPPRGALFVDGRDVHDLPLATLRGAIGFVPQEAFLFSASIRENVAFARDAGSDGAVEAAARDAHLTGDLEGLPGGLETVVGERGITLSGGQKQRAALARALAADAPI
ncbi:MAG: ABC transporter ATP-binding protein, partial [Planctomycetota bacterium]